jgi:hypothetical protein
MRHTCEGTLAESVKVTMEGIRVRNRAPTVTLDAAGRSSAKLVTPVKSNGADIRTFGVINTPAFGNAETALKSNEVCTLYVYFLTAVLILMGVRTTLGSGQESRFGLGKMATMLTWRLSHCNSMKVLVVLKGLILPSSYALLLIPLS